MKTAKEKANELVDKFEDDLMECDTYFLEQAKKRCALIAVEEILKRTRSVDTMPPNYQKIDENTKEYWEQVKIEIQKL
jgi:vacuolar-type H+-ATPase subunit H